MGFVSTVSGHLVIEDGIALDVVEAALAELPPAGDADWPPLSRDAFSRPSPLTYKGEAVITFGFTAKEIEDDLASWLEQFEGLLAQILAATDDPRAICRALVVVDSQTRSHPTSTAGVHLYRWARMESAYDAGPLRIEHDDVLSPGFSSRYAGPAPDRLTAFVEQVTRTQIVFGLRGDGWARTRDEQGIECLPFWGNAKDAARAARGPWADHVPKEIGLEGFIADWLTGMVEDGIVTAISPGPVDAGEAVTAYDLLVRLQSSL